MSRVIQVEERDFTAMVTVLQYVATRYAGRDVAMVAYVKEVLSMVTSHVDNERFGSSEAAEIDQVMDFIARGNNGPAGKTETSGRTRVRRETRVVEESDLQALFRDSSGKGDD